MTLFFMLLILATLGLVLMVATGRIRGGMDDPETSIPARALPDGPVSGADLDGLRFVPAVRGYRMDQVDATLDRLKGELDRRDAEISDLRSRLEAGPEPGDGDVVGAPEPARVEASAPDRGTDG